MSKPQFWSTPLRYLRWASHEKPAIFYSMIIGTSGPVLLTVLPPIRRFFGDVDPEPIPLTYPSKNGLLFLLFSICFALHVFRLCMFDFVVANVSPRAIISPERPPIYPTRLRRRVKNRKNQPTTKSEIDIDGSCLLCEIISKICFRFDVYLTPESLI